MWTAGRPVKTTSEDLARQWAVFFFWCVTVAGVLGLAYFIFAILSRPWYSTVCTLTFIMIWRYVSHPLSSWHESQYSENQFWMSIAFMLSSASMFAPDSPYSVIGWLDHKIGTFVGVSFVIFCTFCAHVIDKRVHYSKLVEIPLRGVVWDKFRQTTTTTNSELMGILNDLMRDLASTPLSTFWNMGKYLCVERDIISLFRDCTADELNFLVCSVEMKLLVYKMKNHNKSSGTVGGGIDFPSMSLSSQFSQLNRSRSHLMDLLANKRVSDLSIPARVVVLDIISSLRMTAHPDTREEAQGWIGRVLTTLKGDDLSELKQIVDNKGNAESMQKLLTVDITDASVRNRILAYFSQQARTQAAQMLMRSSLARRRLNKGPWRKILSDIDDTLFSSGGRYPAGIDTLYGRKVFYPGITALYKELDIGIVGKNAESGVWDPNRYGNLVFLSARPHVYKDLTETTMYSKFHRFMQKNDLHCMPTLLPGDMTSAQAYMMHGNYLPMAEKKMFNFEQFYSIYPEYKHVFVGDNGQADVKAAELMIEKFGRDVIERVYIHIVQPIECTYGYQPGISEIKWKAYGIVFCKSYIHAAIDAATCGLIRVEGLRRIVETARCDFLKIRHTWKDPYHRDTMLAAMNEDIEFANLFLSRAHLPSVPTIYGECVFLPGSKVRTPFGVGFVSSYRPLDGVYKVILDWKVGAGDPPALYTVLHSIYPTEKRLKQMQQVWFDQDSGRSDLRYNFRAVRVNTPAKSGEILDSENSRKISGRWERRSASIASASTSSEASFPSFGKKALNVRMSVDDVDELLEEELEGDVDRFVAKSSSEILPGYCCRSYSCPGIRSGMASFGSSASNESVSAWSNVEEVEASVLDVGASVNTPYGQGIVLEYRVIDAIYELVLVASNRSILRMFASEVSLVLWNPKIFEERANVMAERGYFSNRIADLVKIIFLRGTDAAQATGGAKGAAYLGEVASNIGQENDLNTPFGRGQLVNYRKDDKIFVIRLNWGAMAFLNEASVSTDIPGTPRESFSQGIESSLHISPLQRARRFVGDKLDILRFPFTSAGSKNIESSINISKASEIGGVILSDASIVNKTVTWVSKEPEIISGNKPIGEKLRDLWSLQPGNQVHTAYFGFGELLDTRSDGMFVVKYGFGVGYFSVPRTTNELGPEICEGTKVFTDYGIGTLVENRSKDCTCVISFDHWSGTLYQRYDSSRIAHDQCPDEKEKTTTTNSKQSQGSGLLRSGLMALFSNILPIGDNTSAKVLTDGKMQEVDSHGSPDILIELQYAAEADANGPESQWNCRRSLIPGHTLYSWKALSAENSVGNTEDAKRAMTLSPVRIPPGHTQFSWTFGIDQLGELHQAPIPRNIA